LAEELRTPSTGNENHPSRTKVYLKSGQGERDAPVRSVETCVKKKRTDHG